MNEGNGEGKEREGKYGMATEGREKFLKIGKKGKMFKDERGGERWALTKTKIICYYFVNMCFSRHIFNFSPSCDVHAF